MTTTDWTAHRKHPRRELDAPPVYLDVWQPDRGWRSTQGRVLDISFGGVGLLVRDPLPKGTWLRLAVEAHEGNVRSGRHGRVAACVADERAGTWRVGVSFQPTPPSGASHAAALGICFFTAAALWTNAPAMDSFGEVACAAVMSFLLLALAAAAHWQYKQTEGQYERQRVMWAHAWRDIEDAFSEAPRYDRAPARYVEASAPVGQPSLSS